MIRVLNKIFGRDKLLKEEASGMSDQAVNTIPSEDKKRNRDKEAIYLKALPLRSLDDVEAIKGEVRSGNILIVKITPLAQKSINEVYDAVQILCQFIEAIGGDIARLGQERIVLTPPSIKIWRKDKK